MIIDDFGLKPLRSPDDEDFHDLVAEHYERCANILTSNLDFPEWGEALKIILNGESYRSLKTGGDRAKTSIAKGGKITHS